MKITFIERPRNGDIIGNFFKDQNSTNFLGCSGPQLLF